MQENFRILIAGLFAAIVATTGCGEIGTWEEQERKQIDDYLKALGDTVYVLKPSGLYYIELIEGTGVAPVENDTVFFWYTGSFLDGVVFESNRSGTDPLRVILGNNQLIEGIDEGVRYMKEGGKARLLTPSSLAYGHEGWWGIIPGYTPLVWTIDLVSVRPGP